MLLYWQFSGILHKRKNVFRWSKGLADKYLTRNSEETFELGRTLGQSLKDGEIVALYGGLGAGKTVFAKGIASGLAIEEEVTSPTFTLLKTYKGRLALNHFDLYRIEDEEELAQTGFYDYLGGEGACVIEWADRASLPPCISVTLEGSGADARTITIERLRG
jgi:tRNA threonylcarbamoyladenosine biosynthesis protein TsaE